MRRLVLGLMAAALGLTACKKEEPATPGSEGSQSQSQPVSDIKTDKGVDLEKKVVYVGALNDESGPGAAIGKPFAAGKRLLARQVNAGNSGLLPEGWKLELVEKDHAYNPQNSVQAYSDIHDRVLFLGTSFGTPNTLPLRDKLAADGMVAFPASQSSEMARNQYTPPIGASYKMEAMRAMDWAVEHAGGADKVKAAIVYQGDDYGKDGIDGWTAAAKHHGVTVVSQQTVAPGQKDFAAVVTALQQSGANYVLLTVLPSASGPILGTAAQLKYLPTWVGQTPAWVDRFFDPKVIPAAVFTNFYWATGLTYWGDDVPGMKDFLALHGQHADVPKDFYTLSSYVQGLVQVEALKKAIEAKDVTRAGYLKALKAITGTTARGMAAEPVDLSRFPYETSVSVRVLKPVMDQGSWRVVAGYAKPKALDASAAKASDDSK
ncbi:ABC transporter substrate-binding protein [Pyxidicoccus sp. MSG2]|uniref:ABC transporter substrate-binding protein n=1 Tax=Pyxidicoccus sp. MSG2 TaxID=2996790 RepID=UPI00226FD4A4|nr:ABC transporter substrate-binding protein [Pyxidicoccus sp. MSG2]MCY1022348.1 ABC transporter substrate-binding protein [Pyxidicoccus sp. MSG2]